NGNELVHALPPGPELIGKVHPGAAGAPADHGVISALAVYAPHNGGFTSAARGPPKKLNRRLLNGTSGLFRNLVTSCPVTGSGVTSPASLTSTPDCGSLTVR